MPADPAKDSFLNHARTASEPARNAAAVTPSYGADLAVYAKALYVGQAGDVALVPIGGADGSPVVFTGHPVGYLPVQARRVMSTGTTAAQIVALFD